MDRAQSSELVIYYCALCQRRTDAYSLAPTGLCPPCDYNAESDLDKP